jgi:hypothetical protein
MGVDKLSVVPEVFYDLISRVPAGMIVLVTACVVLQDCNLPTIIASIDSSPIPAIVVPVVGFVLSYVIGLALSALSGPLLYPRFDRWHKKTINERLEDLRGLPRGGDHIGAAKDNPESRRKAQMGLNIFLKQKDARIGFEMSKHQAETSLFANLTVGFAALLVAFLYSYWISKPPCASLALNACRIVTLLGATSVIVAFLRYLSGWRHLFGFGESYLKRSSSSEADPDTE